VIFFIYQVIAVSPQWPVGAVGDARISGIFHREHSAGRLGQRVNQGEDERIRAVPQLLVLGSHTPGLGVKSTKNEP